MLATLLLTVTGCGGDGKDSALFVAMTDRDSDFRLDVLREKKILIDPGHGGRYRGTNGREGLEEASVNLAVSLLLRDMLQEAGADVHMTRADDRDFLPEGAENDLAADLAARVAISDSLAPDLFLSLHHNARGDSTFNQIEVYYPMTDEGPSRDAARAIFFHLKRNFGEDEGRTYAGNFHVLRNGGAPAVLCESAYLSHPPVEARLKLREGQEIEARSLFYGIARYFMSGAPRARFMRRDESEIGHGSETGGESHAADGMASSSADTLRSVDAFHVQAIVRDESGFPGIDPTSIELTLDGSPLPHRFLPGSDRVQAALPYHITNAGHELVLRARNLNGNSTNVARYSIVVDLPVADLAASAVLSPPGDSAVSYISVAVNDSRGLAIRDQMASVDETGGENTGAGGTGAESIGADNAASGVRGMLRQGRLSNLPFRSPRFDSLLLTLDRETIPFTISGANVQRYGAFIEATEPYAAVWEGDRFLGYADEFGNMPVAGGARAGSDTDASAGRDAGAGKHGAYDATGAQSRLEIRRSWLAAEVGRQPSARKSAELAALVRAGSLPAEYQERRVLIDPGGGRGSASLFPPNEQALALARMMQEMFTYYGITSQLTHQEFEPPPLEERVRVANEWFATYWITLEPATDFSILHFPGNRFSGPDSELTADLLGTLLGQDIPVSTDRRLELRDTPCTAVVVEFPWLPDESLASMTMLRTIAQGVAEGLTRAMIYQSRPDELLEKYVIRDRRAGDLIRVNDAITFQVLRDGDFKLWQVIHPGFVREIWILRNGAWSEYPVSEEMKAPGTLSMIR